MAYKAFIALGSNIEPRVRTVLSSLHLLDVSEGIRVDKVSPVYVSEAHTGGGPPQPDYLNAVARVSTILGPAALLERCLDIEKSLGRERHEDAKWRSRRIDLDVLLHSAGRASGHGIEIPHPRIAERFFVLLPLADVMPQGEFLEDLGAPLEDLIASCPDEARILKTVVNLGNYK